MPNIKKLFIDTKNPPKDLSEPKVAKNSYKIMEKRSFLKENGKYIEGPKEMFWRVASAMANEDGKYLKVTKNKKVENTAREFYTLMSENRFLPGARVLYEAGNDIDGTGQLSSCFVLPIEDDLASIFQTMQEAAIVQKNNGGTGFNFSHIRPKGDSVGGTPNVAAGPVHFIRSFSQAFDNILQGKKRGGGNMAILNVNHPDIIEFINLKGRDESIRNFNISVGVTDAFMEAVRNDEEYDLVNPRTNQVVKRIRAREVFDLICEKAWDCADPGLFFLDTAQNANPTKPLGIIEATNPCGEEPLRSYESCNLGSIVLPTHLKEINGRLQIDWDLMKESVRSSTHFLDNMIDLSRFPLEKIQKEVNSTRKLGLGVVGLGTMFYKMGIAYNSQEAVDLTREIIKFIEEESTIESERLAKERGVFPGFKGSKWEEMARRVRNATMTSVAPTGTLSLIANTSSGIEPIFSLVYKYSGFYQDEGKSERQALIYVNEEFEEYAKAKGFYSEELMMKIAENKGSLHGIDEVPQEAKNIFVVTHDIDPKWHVSMQAAAQDNVDAAVSKTINLPQSATVDDVRHAYVQAWEGRCKGITIYRDGSKSMQVLETTSSAEPEKPVEISTPIAMQVASNSDFVQYEVTPNALQVLEKRALKKDDKGNITEAPEQLWQRIARHVAGAEVKYDGRKARKFEKLFFEVMNSGEFLSGGTLIYAGLGNDAIMSKCLVLPIDDSIDSIFSILNKNIQVLRRGVGTGFNFSKIRSSYSIVSTTGEKAAGPIEYLKMFNRAQDTIKGRGGRGLGSMAILNADHPNVEEFIDLKDDLEAITHYNISVGASDKFMKAVKEDKEWDLVDPHDKKVYKSIKARHLFEKIARHAWISGDPGMFFVDQAEKKNTTPKLGSMQATNPCGEQPLIPYETCNLGNIDVSKMIAGFPYADDPAMVSLPVSKKMDLVNWDRLSEVVKIGIRFLDNIIDVNNYPIPEIEEMTKETRNIGLGIMGFADFLIKLGISYNSPEAEEAAEKLMKFITTNAHEASEEIGAEKGSFPSFKDSVWVTQRNKKAMRNTRTTTIAPTGSVSIIANCNPGIEPIFALGYRRKNSMGGNDQEVIEHLFKYIAKKRGFYSEELISRIADGAHLHDIKEHYNIPQDVVDVFVTTHEIKPEHHVHIQSAFQKYTDSAVSKTINLPNSATWQDIAKVYELAYDLGCKGITVFRDGSKDPALQVGTKKKETSSVEASEVKEKVVIKEVPVVRNSLQPRQRPDVVKGFTYKIDTNQGDLFIIINEDEQGMFEIFIQGAGKSGSYTAGYIEAIGRLVSISLRSGVEVEEIIKQLQGIRSAQPTLNRGGVIVYSVPDAVAKVLKKHIEQRQNQIQMFEQQQQTALVVPTEELVETPAADLRVAEPEPQADVEAVITETITQTVEVDLGKSVSAAAVSDDTSSKYGKENTTGDMMECPDCGGDLEYAEGCILCRSCGFSKCG